MPAVTAFLGRFRVHFLLQKGDFHFLDVFEVRWPFAGPEADDAAADLGYALNTWAEPGEGREGAATALPGFPTRVELAARYEERSGRDLSKLNYYIGFNWWKSACIVHGVYARYCAGKKSTEGVDMGDFRSRIGEALNASEKALATLR